MPRTQIETLIAPRGGLNLSLPADLISPLEMSDCCNVFFEEGLIKKRYGYKKFGGNLPLFGALMGFDQYYQFGGNSYLLAMTTKDIYCWNATTKEWDSIGAGVGESTAYGAGAYGAGAYGGMHPESYGAGAYGAGAYGAQKGAIFTGTDKDFFSYDYMRKLTEEEPWWLCTNGVDNIKKFDGKTLSDLGGSPPKAKHLIEFKDHLHLSDVTEGGKRLPQRDRWSDTGKPDEWETGNASYKDLPGADWISAPFKFKGDYLALIKERSIRLGQATGDSEIFVFPVVSSDVGASSGRTIESLGDELIFLGWDDVYFFNGIDYESAAEKIQVELFRTLNPEELERNFGVIIEEQKEYHLHVVPTGESYPKMDWCFNYDLNKWTKNKYAHYLTSYGYYFLEMSKRWCDLTGSWAEQAWKWGDRTVLAYSPTTLFGDKDGYVYEYTRGENNDDGVAIDSYFDTKDFTFTQLISRQRVVGLNVYYKGSSLEIYYSADKGATWNLIKELSASDNLETPKKIRGLRINSRQIRFRFRNAELNEHFDFDRAEIYWQPAGARL